MAEENLEEEEIFKISILSNTVKSIGIIPSDFIHIVHVLDCVNEYKDMLTKHIDKFLDHIENMDDVPESIRNILHIRKRNNEILSVVNRLKDLENDDKEQIARDLNGLINGGR